MATIPDWFRLDNAAIIFPILSSRRYTTFFRMSATLDKPVRYAALEKAVLKCMDRFPYFFVRLRKGFFWHFFQKTTNLPIYLDSQSPCMRLPKYKGLKDSLRIRVYKKRIALEISHYLTDGTGAIEFLKTLLFYYFEEMGITGEAKNLAIDPHGETEDKEWEDSFLTHYKKKLPPPPKYSKAFKIPYHLSKKGKYYITTGKVPLDKIKEVSKSKGVSITEFLLAYYIYAFQELFYKTKGKKPIRIMVPVNLRKLYPSRTMKNFFLTVPITLDPRLGRYTIEEIMNKVHHYMRVEVDQKFINQQITRNVRGVFLPITRVMPLFVKITFIKMIAKKEEKNFTSSLSNLGPVMIPDWMEKHVENFLFFPPPGPSDKTNCSILSYKGNLYISVGRSIEKNPIEKVFFHSLIKEGIPVKISVNQKES